MEVFKRKKARVFRRADNGTSILNVSSSLPDYSKEQLSSSYSSTTQPIFVENNKVSEERIANSTRTIGNTTFNKNVVIYVVLACTVLLFLLGGVFCLICCINKSSKKKKALESAQFSCNNDDANPSKALEMEALYAFPEKKHLKFKLKLHKKKGQLKGYDTVGSVIPGTYQEHSLSVSSIEKISYTNATSISSKAINTSPILGEDIPFKPIASRSSFNPKRLQLPENGSPKEENETYKYNEKQELLQSEWSNSKENQVKHDFNVENSNNLQNENMSFFKPGTSVRIKQQRTSRRNAKENKPNTPLRELVHEDVSITPPIPKRFSPDLNDSRINLEEAKNISLKKKSPAVPKRTSSIKNVKQDNVNDAIDSSNTKHKYDIVEMQDSVNIKSYFQNNFEAVIKVDIEAQCVKDTNKNEIENII